MSISPIAQHKKPRRSPLRLRFLCCTLEEISCATCITYFSTVPYDIIKDNAVYKNIESYEEPSKCDEYNLELKEAYASIEERYRLPMELYYSQGFKMREIAEMLSLPLNTIKTRISRGRQYTLNSKIWERSQKQRLFLQWRGEWNFEINLSDVSSTQNIKVGQKVEGTGFTMEDINISPISIRVNYSVSTAPVKKEDDLGI